VSAYAKNLFNSERVLSRLASPYFAGYGNVLPGGASGAAFSNYRGISVTQPREFGLTGTFRFGSR
jgi:hypothetical protein